MTGSIVTKRGDKGTTDVFGQTNIPKDSPRLHAYGDIDELNAILGLLLNEPLPDAISRTVERIQHLLFRMGADIATPSSVLHENIKRVRPEDTSYLERQIATLESVLPLQRSFILPKGSRPGSLLHHARAICRRAERWTVTVARIESVNPHLLIALNRLSDYLFIAARTASRHMNTPEEPVDYS